MPPIPNPGTESNGGKDSPQSSLELSEHPVTPVKDSPLLSTPTSPTGDRPSSGGVGTVAPPTSTSLGSGSDPPMYSPSEVELYMTCPRLWWYTKRGWIPRTEHWTHNILVGQAVQEGLNAQLEGRDPKAAMDQEIEREWNPNQEYILKDAVRNLTYKGYNEVLKAELGSGITIISLNRTIHGRKPDLVGRRLNGGGLRVVDLKVSVSLTRDKMKYRQSEWNRSWQLRDYAWFCEEFFQEQVVEAAICQVAIGPKAFVEVWPVEITPTILFQWHESAVEWWREMWQYLDLPQKPPMNTRACDVRALHYGKDRCVMYDGCHLYFGDESKFPALYYNKFEEEQS